MYDVVIRQFVKLRGHYSFFCAHAMQHAPLHARVKKHLYGDFAMQQKTLAWSMKFVPGAMGQNRFKCSGPLWDNFVGQKGDAITSFAGGTIKIL